jgi:hypothetical protein
MSIIENGDKSARDGAGSHLNASGSSANCAGNLRQGFFIGWSLIESITIAPIRLSDEPQLSQPAHATVIRISDARA